MHHYTNTQRGFTLIELLVVVLIIAILAAVALPQYQKAVAKSRYAILKPLVDSMYQAQHLYYLTNGTYADSFSKLEIDTGGHQSGKYVYFSWGSCTIELTNKYVYCQNPKTKISYLSSFSGKRVCVAYDGNKTAHKICKEETGDNNPTGNSNWYRYP